jgi:hypothetical protein
MHEALVLSPALQNSKEKGDHNDTHLIGSLRDSREIIQANCSKNTPCIIILS